MKLPQKISAWAIAFTAVLTAIVMVLGPGKTAMVQFAKDAIAQEATKQFAPAVQEMSSIKDLLRRKEDRELIAECKLTKADPQCARESDLRWRIYAWEDEGKIGDKPTLTP